jgi:glycosyltransferase involved in cell wall biosynthesis
LVDKFYFIKGGAERYYFEWKEILEAHGHEVIPFSMRHPNNFDTPYADYFADRIEFQGSKLQRLATAPRAVGRVIYSMQARRRIEELIAKTRPDLAHIHMIDHQLSPSILLGIKKFGMPIIQTVHQYKLVCPNYRLFIDRDRRICEKCLGGKFYHPVLEKCHQDSRAASVLIALESYVHKWMRVYDHIDLFHVPSTFMGKKLRAGGIAAERIRHLFYTIKLKEYPYHPESKDYFIYFGRLSGEKGITTLLHAMKDFKGSQLKIVGDGPEEARLKALTKEWRLPVEFLGSKHGEELKRIVANARFIVVPSEWYENSPLVIYEAFAMGKPVIGADIGGITELIAHGEDGYLFSPGKAEALRRCLEMLDRDEGKIKRFGEMARRKAEARFAPAKHYEVMMGWYEELLDRSRPPRTKTERAHAR